ATAGDLDRWGLEIALDVDGRADVGIAVLRLRVATDQHGNVAAHQGAHRNVDVVPRPQFDGKRRLDQAACDLFAQLRGARLQDVEVLVRQRGIVYRQADRTRVGGDLQHVERRVDLGHVDVGYGIHEQAPDAGHRAVDLHRVRRLADAGAVDLDVVLERADRAGGDQVDVPALDVRRVVVVRIEHRAAQRDEHHVVLLRRDAADVKVSRDLAQVVPVVGQRVDLAGGLLRRVDFQEVVEEADAAVGRPQRDAVADDPGRGTVVAGARHLVDRTGAGLGIADGLGADIAFIGLRDVDAQVARGFGHADVAVGHHVDVAIAQHVGVRCDVDRRSE